MPNCMNSRLHKYTGTNCGLKRLQQLSEIWKNHADELRRLRMHAQEKGISMLNVTKI